MCKCGGRHVEIKGRQYCERDLEKYKVIYGEYPFGYTPQRCGALETAPEARSQARAEAQRVEPYR